MGSFRSRLALATAVSLGLVDGCTGPRAVFGPPNGTSSAAHAARTKVDPRPARIAPNATRAKLLYIARYSFGDVQIYDSRSLGLVGDLTGFTNPRSVAVDDQRNVYVVDQGSNHVFAFHVGATTPFETLTDPDGIAFQVAVGHDGKVYLSNEYSFSLGNGNVAEYASGSTNPTREITNRQFSVVEDVGLDSKNNLYVTYDDQHVIGRINEYAPGSTHGKMLPLSLKATGGIEFDAADDLVVCDPVVPAVKVFAQGSRSPKYEFATGQIDPFDVALTSHAARAFVSDPFSGNTYEYSLPSGSLLHAITNPSYSISGIAVER
jgi:hypothetical protein